MRSRDSRPRRHSYGFFSGSLAIAMTIAAFAVVIFIMAGGSAGVRCCAPSLEDRP